MSLEHVDVLIVGAGLSGIGAGYHVQDKCPGKTFTILEARSSIGGTWDLFRYPGVRSDSDMYTLGFRFRPWPDAKAIADGPAILSYVRETASKYDSTSDRERRPNFLQIRRQNSSTVLGLMPSSAAAAFVSRPRAPARATSRSR